MCLLLLTGSALCLPFRAVGQINLKEEAGGIENFYREYITNIMENRKEKNDVLMQQHFTPELIKEVEKERRKKGFDKVIDGLDVNKKTVNGLQVGIGGIIGKNDSITHELTYRWTDWDKQTNNIIRILVCVVKKDGKRLIGDIQPGKRQSWEERMGPLRPYTTPELEFFCNLYDDDFIGDTLTVNGKHYFFQQSSMKQFPNYMFGKEDLRIVLAFGGVPTTYGMPDKGYVLRFGVDNDLVAYVEAAIYNGTIYPEEMNGKPMEMERIASLTGEKLKNGKIRATWLHGRYRINEMQPLPNKPPRGKQFIAEFERGRLVRLSNWGQKKAFKYPMVDLRENTEGVSIHDFHPEYLYIEHPDKSLRKEKREDVIKRYRWEMERTYLKEPFLDRACIDALNRAGVKL